MKNPKWLKIFGKYLMNLPIRSVSDSSNSAGVRSDYPLLMRSLLEIVLDLWLSLLLIVDNRIVIKLSRKLILAFSISNFLNILISILLEKEYF